MLLICSAGVLLTLDTFQVAETEERWDQMTIALTHVPQDLYPFAFASSDRQKGGASRRAGDKTTTFALDLPSLQVNTPNKQGLLSVSNDAHVQLMLEDSITCLKLLLGSPHSVGMRPRMEAMLSTLRQLGELFMSLVDGLRKVSNHVGMSPCRDVTMCRDCKHVGMSPDL